MVREYTLFDLNPLKFIKTCLMAQNSILVNVSFVFEKNAYFAVVGWNSECQFKFRWLRKIQDDRRVNGSHN